MSETPSQWHPATVPIIKKEFEQELKGLLVEPHLIVVFIAKFCDFDQIAIAKQAIPTQLNISSSSPRLNMANFAQSALFYLKSLAPELLQLVLPNAFNTVASASGKIPQCNVFATAMLGIPFISDADTRSQKLTSSISNQPKRVRRWMRKFCGCCGEFPATGECGKMLEWFEHQLTVALAGNKNCQKIAGDIMKQIQKLKKQKTGEDNIAKLSAELTAQTATFSTSSLELLARVMQFTGCHPGSLPETPEVIAFVLARLQIVVEDFGAGETRPTFTALTDAFRDLVDTKTCPGNVALEIASISNIERAWQRVCVDIQTHNDYTPVREMRDMWLKQANQIAQLICNLKETGRVKPDYITCLGSRSSGEVQLLNALTWFLNVLRKKLRRVCSILSNDPGATLEDVSVWQFVMSLPPAVRMLDIPVYTWAEMLCAVMYKRNDRLQLHNIVAGRVEHSLEKFLEMVTETKKKCAIPDDEVIPLTELTHAEKISKTTKDRDDFLKTLGALGIKSGDFFRSTQGKPCEKCTTSGASAAAASVVPLCTCRE